MPFIVKTRTGMLGEQLNQGINQGLLAYMQGMKVASDIGMTKAKMDLAKTASERADAAAGRQEEQQDWARERHGEWQANEALRDETAQLDIESKRLAGLTAPTPEETARLRGLNLTLVENRAKLSTFETGQRGVVAAQWGDTVKQAIIYTEGLGMAMTQDQRDSINAIEWSPAAEGLLNARIAGITSEWGLGKKQEFLTDVSAWDDVDPTTGEPTSQYADVAHIAAMAVGRMDTSDAQSVTSMQIGIDHLKRNEGIRKEAITWASDDEQTTIINEKIRAADSGVRVQGMPAGSPSYAQNQYSARWYKLKDQLKQSARVAADGSIEYGEDYEYTRRQMEAHLKLNPGDPGAGGPTAGGGGGGGTDLSARDVDGATVDPRATISKGEVAADDQSLTQDQYRAIEKTVDNSVAARPQVNQFMDDMRTVLNYEWTDVPTPEAVYERIKGLNPESAELLEGSDGRFDLNLLKYYLQRAAQRKKDIKVRTERVGPTGTDWGFD